MYKDFVHLHVHTEYSMLDSIAKINDLVAYAKELGMKSLAMTDHGNLYATVKFYNACKKNGIKPIIGCEIYTTNHLDEKVRDNYHLILLAKNEEGYHNLVRIVSEASEHQYYRYRVDKNILRKYHEGLICLSACVAGEIPRDIIDGDFDSACKCAEDFISIFGKDDFYIELQNHGLDKEKQCHKRLVEIAHKYGLKMVATNDCHYVRKEDWEAQDVIYCIKQQQENKNITIDTVDRMRLETQEFYLKSAEEMNAVFHDFEGCLSNSAEIADKCNVELKMGNKLAPKFPSVPNGMTEDSYLRSLCEKTIHQKYPTEEGYSKAKARMEYELGVISKMHYSGYFLIVWDFINWATENGISIGPGRGSGAGSIVCYLTGITKLDPLALNLLFERFLNPERVSMPDIDTDIARAGRDAVADYMMKKYHYDKSAKIFTVQTMALKGSIRNVTKVFGYPFSLGSEIIQHIGKDASTVKEALEQSEDLKKFYDTNEQVKTVLRISEKIQGLPRQSGTHAAGIVISEYPLKDYIPIEKMADGLHTEFDKDEVEKLGLLKMDLLGLVNLDIIADAKKLIQKKYGKEIDFSKVPLDDEKTMKMLREGDTFGVFQLESNGMTELVEKLAPNNYNDLIPLVALYRPGPLGSGMVDDFINCRHGRQEIKYMHPLLEPILKETFGVILYQEQVMQIVQTLAGFSLGKADIMRRAMGHKEPELLKQQKADFVNGCKAKNNISEELATKIFDLMMHFASYGFNKSHSAAYAFLAYETAYLKANYPLEYISAYISHNLSDDAKLNEAVSICKKNGIRLLPPNVMRSEYEFVPEGKDIRFGFGAISGFGSILSKLIIEERNKEPFHSVTDFLYRIFKNGNISRDIFEKLCKIGAFSDLYEATELLCRYNMDVYDAIRAFEKKTRKKSSEIDDISESLFSDEELKASEVQPPEVGDCYPEHIDYPKKFTTTDILAIQKEVLGFYITNPLDYCGDTLKYCKPVKWIMNNAEILSQTKDHVNVCGVLDRLRTIYTKKGDKMAFVQLAIYDTKVEFVVFPRVYAEAEKNGFWDKSIFLMQGCEVQMRDGKVQLVPSKVRGKDL